MSRTERGHLLDTSSAPDTGERVYEIVNTRSVTIEQVLSGEIEPVGYLQAEDEWALVLSGSAMLELDGERIELGTGDWLFIPAGVPHRLLGAEPGTNWLTVKASRD